MIKRFQSQDRLPNLRKHHDMKTRCVKCQKLIDIGNDAMGKRLYIECRGCGSEFIAEFESRTPTGDVVRELERTIKPKRKRKSEIVYWTIAISFVLLALTIVVSEAVKQPSFENFQAKEDSKIESMFAMDGSCYPVIKYIEARLHNPDRFQHVSTRYKKTGADQITVWMTCRAENGFGALRLTERCYTVSISRQEVIADLTVE